MRNLAILSSIIFVLLLAGCQQQGPYGQVCYPLDEEGNPVIPASDITDETVLDDITGEVITDIEEDTTQDDMSELIEDEETEEDTVVIIEDEDVELEEDTVVEQEEDDKLVYTEGEVVDLSIFNAVDEDGDPLEYIYEEPFSEDGTWETEVGDAGTYTTTITVTDGTSSATLDVDFEVMAQNQPPVFMRAEDVEVRAGQVVELDVAVEDPDGDDLEITYSGWMEEASMATDSADIGEHIVTVTASDGLNEVSEDITVRVLEENKPPVFEPIQDMIVQAGDTVEIEPVVTDPEGEDVTITFNSPLSEDGTWETTNNDIGSHVLQMIASDGENEVLKNVRVFVQAANAAPVIQEMDPIIVEETDTIILEPSVTDPDGDEVEISYSGWMNSDTKVTGYDDEGEYTVTITASDGENEASIDVEIVVLNKNRPPSFVG